jgi:uncharacterized protein (DUF2164 family)
MRGKHAIELSRDDKAKAIASLKRYLREELDDDVGDLKADIFLGFILEELGPTIYNQALADARTFFEERLADLEGVCYQHEFPYWVGK